MDNRLKGLLFGDDIRFKTGVARVLHNLIEFTHDRIDWVQYGGAKKHPDPDRIVNFKDWCKIYPSKEGYGNRATISDLIKLEEPDFIFLMTDPRYFESHFRMEYEIRQNIPIIYYNIWDNFPIPFYNESYYNSCDGLACINKQTEYIVNKLVTGNQIVDYIPHGINMDQYYPLDKKFKMDDIKELFKKCMPEFEYNKNLSNIKKLRKKKVKYLWLGKNQRRKRPIDVIYSFMRECKENEEFFKDSALIMHTDPIGETDLPACIRDFSREFDIKLDNIVFTSSSSLSDEDLNELYNFCDLLINSSDAEGFGLPVAEAVAAGLGVIHTVTGGIQDQFPYKELYTDESPMSRNTYTQKNGDLDTLYNNEYEGREWSLPVFPSGTSLIGAVQTPYIFEDSVSVYDLQKAISLGHKNYKGLKRNARKYGREYLIKNEMSVDSMCDNLYNHINKVVDNFTPKEKVEVINV